MAAATEVKMECKIFGSVGKWEIEDIPYFGRFVPINEMKAFFSAASFCWCEEKYWYTPKQDALWEVFLSCINSFNDQRT